MDPRREVIVFPVPVGMSKNTGDPISVAGVPKTLIFSKLYGSICLPFSSKCLTILPTDTLPDLL